MPAEKTLRPGKPEAGSTVHHVRAERFELVPYKSVLCCCTENPEAGYAS